MRGADAARGAIEHGQAARKTSVCDSAPSMAARNGLLTALEHAFQAEITQTIIIKRDFKLRTQTPMREREGKQKKTATSRTVSLEPAPKQPPQADITPLSSEKITVVVSVIVVVLVAVPTASAVPRLAAPRSVVI